MVFGNKTLPRHLMRGVLGFGALAASLATANTTIWPTLVLMPFALWMLKGCPICWTIGLFETVAQRLHRHTDNAAPVSIEPSPGAP
ncbi:MAG TPA: hypothetical protein VIF60_11815 [Burkholderiaceae bacterium]|jgi:hypothetical protein